MRILDLVAIHAPQIGPAPGLLEEFACDTPQRVALLDRVTVRGVVLKLYFLRLQYARREQKRQQARRKVRADDRLDETVV